MNLCQASHQYRDQQILTAGPGELILMLYDAAIRQVRLARLAMSEQQPAQAGSALIKAQEIVDALIDGLNLDYDIAEPLLHLYDFINHELMLANVNKVDTHAAMAESLLRDLRETWAVAVQSDRALGRVASV
jgi:flagellar protein FliS